MNCRNILTKEVYLELYNQGLTDQQIAIKLGMHHSYISKYRKNKLSLPLVRDNIVLTKYQEEVLIGTLLGDSSIRKVHSKMLNNNLTFAHSTKHREYFINKVTILNNIISSTGEYNCKSKFIVGNKLVATGKALKCMNIYRDIFYPNGIKIIPLDYLIEKFTEVSLSYLFMDDGNKNGNTINLNMQSFSIEELQGFVNLLRDKFNLIFNIKKDKTLYLTYSSRENFYTLVNRYIINEMKYKLSGVKLSLNSVNCLENPEMDNQQPSSYGDIEKGSTTSSESQVDDNSTTKAEQSKVGIYKEIPNCKYLTLKEVLNSLR